MRYPNIITRNIDQTPWAYAKNQAIYEAYAEYINIPHLGTWERL